MNAPPQHGPPRPTDRQRDPKFCCWRYLLPLSLPFTDRQMDALSIPGTTWVRAALGTVPTAECSLLSVAHQSRSPIGSAKLGPLVFILLL